MGETSTVGIVWRNDDSSVEGTITDFSHEIIKVHFVKTCRRLLTDVFISLIKSKTSNNMNMLNDLEVKYNVHEQTKVSIKKVMRNAL